MAHAQYAPPGPPRYAPPQIDVISGGGNLLAGSMWISVQGQNRAGLNLHSAPQFVSWNDGDRIDITLPESYRPSACEPIAWVISGSEDDDVINMAQLCEVPAFESGGADTVLPFTVSLYERTHVQLRQSVPNAAALPAGTRRIHGMMRGLEDLGFIYRYDEYEVRADEPPRYLLAAPGGWVRVGNYSTFYSTWDTTAEGGCDRPISLLDDPRDVVKPRYEADGSVSRPVRFWLFFDRRIAGDAAGPGKRAGLSFFINGEPYSQLIKAGNQVQVLVHGYGNINSGELDVTDLINVGGLRNLEFGEPLYTLERSLAGGIAVVFDVSLQIDAANFAGDVVNGDVISVAPRWLPGGGTYVPGVTSLLGNVATEYNNGILRVHPRTGYSLRTEPGELYLFDRVSTLDATVVYGLQENTPGQKAILDSNGYWRVVQSSTSVQEPEIIRAVVSTESGESRARWGEYFTVAANSSIEVVITHPQLIRGDYPDLIAASDSPELNATGIAIYVQRMSNLEIRRFEYGVVSGTGTAQDIALGDFTAGAVVTELPSDPSSDFGFWHPTTPLTTELATGSFLADDYRIAYSYLYDGSTASKINHQPDPLTYLQEFRADLGRIAYTNVAQQFSGYQGLVPVQVADADTISFDLSKGNRFELTLDGTRAFRFLAAPYRLRPGNFDLWIFTPGNTELLFSDAYKFPAGGETSITQIAGGTRVHVLSCVVSSQGLILATLSPYYVV